MSSKVTVNFDKDGILQEWHFESDRKKDDHYDSKRDQNGMFDIRSGLYDFSTKKKDELNQLDSIKGATLATRELPKEITIIQDNNKNIYNEDSIEEGKRILVELVDKRANSLDAVAWKELTKDRFYNTGKKVSEREYNFKEFEEQKVTEKLEEELSINDIDHKLSEDHPQPLKFNINDGLALLRSMVVVKKLRTILNDSIKEGQRRWDDKIDPEIYKSLLGAINKAENGKVMPIVWEDLDNYLEFKEKHLKSEEHDQADAENKEFGDYLDGMLKELLSGQQKDSKNNDTASNTKTSDKNKTSIDINGLSIETDGSVNMGNGRVSTKGAQYTKVKKDRELLEVLKADITDGIVKGGTVKLNSKVVTANKNDIINLGELNSTIAENFR